MQGHMTSGPFWSVLKALDNTPCILLLSGFGEDPKGTWLTFHEVSLTADRGLFGSYSWRSRGGDSKTAQLGHQSPGITLLVQSA